MSDPLPSRILASGFSIPHGWGAEDVLGPDHPLARIEHRVCWLARQAAALSAVVAAVGLARLAGVLDVPLSAILAIAPVASVLLVALSHARATTRERARDLIAEGRGTLAIASVRRERARLLRAGHADRLSHAIDALRRDARCPYHERPLCGPLYVPAVIRDVDAELARVAVGLRGAPADARVVASVERLLGGARSPLYGGDARFVRDELARIRFAAEGSPQAETLT